MELHLHLGKNNKIKNIGGKMKKKVFVLIACVFTLIISTAVYADQYIGEPISIEYFVCQQAMEIIKIVSIIIAILVVLKIVISKKIKNKKIIKFSTILLVFAIIIWIVTDLVWLVNYIKL